MTIETSAFSLENGLASRGIAGRQIAGRFGGERSEVGDHVSHLLRRHIGLGRHAGAGDSFANNVGDFGVGGGVFELAGTQLDAGDLVAVRTVTIHAIVEVNPRADLRIERIGFVLRQQSSRAYKEDTESDAPGTHGYFTS